MGIVNPNSSLPTPIHQLTIFDELKELLNGACQTFTLSTDIVEFCAPSLNQLILNEPEQVEALVQRLEWPSEEATTYTRRRLLEAANGMWSIYAILLASRTIHSGS